MHGPFSINEIIEELEREQQVRCRVYPGWINTGKIPADVAQARQAKMGAAVNILKTLSHIQGMVRMTEEKPKTPEITQQVLFKTENCSHVWGPAVEVGRCLRRYTCTLCRHTREEDSGD